MKVAEKLLTPENHSLVLIDYEGKMAFAANSHSMQELRQNAGVQPITSVQYVLELQRDWKRPTAGPVSKLMKRYAGTYGIGMQYAEGMLKH